MLAGDSARAAPTWKSCAAIGSGTFDWPTAVERLNRHPHFRVAVDPGLALHVIHRRSSRPDARPLLIAHGWPGSIVEFDQIIDRLAEPAGGGWAGLPCDRSFAGGLRVVGQAFGTDRTPCHGGALYDRLMGVLGYDRYHVSGRPTGAASSAAGSGSTATGVEAIHLSGYGLRSADMRPTDPDEEKWLKKARRVRATETGYLQVQGTKPQSLGFAMMDSPMGVAAWFAEKFAGWADTGDGRKGFVDPPFDLDTMLTNIMIYLTTRSFNTATWLYKGQFDEGGFTIPEGRRIEVPTAVAAFPHDLLAFPPRAMVERGYNVVRYTAMPRGGHFASLEEPELFLADLRAFAAGL